MQHLNYPKPASVLIVGGSGGIGQSIVQAVLDAYDDTKVAATRYRSDVPFEHSRLTWYSLDASISDEVKNLAAAIVEVDWIINCVGFLHSQRSGPEKTIQHIDTRFLMQNIELNTLPTVLLAQHFNTQFKRSKAPKLATLSARVGSIEENYLGGWYSYRMSKAALNMALKTLSIEWNRSHPNGCVAALHPGTNNTALSKPFQANVPQSQLLEPKHTSKLMINLLARLQPQDSGKFWTWEGENLPW